MIAKHLSAFMAPFWLSAPSFLPVVLPAQGRLISVLVLVLRLVMGSVFRIQERLLFPQSAGPQIISPFQNEDKITAEEEGLATHVQF
ncbi:hypothetical protein BDR06DRAFT_955234 [Suillus hirtellus]|nr:hypothetical protein BDR06DRAFT_955234 [Suillus hirtellus]